MNIVNILKYIVTHPLNSNNKIKAIIRFFKWQGGSRLLEYPVIYDFIEGTKLIISRGQTSMTGNIYTGLTSYEPMSFLLHYLNEDDTMIDIGANAGIFSVLAAGVSKSFVIAAEPIPNTFKQLEDNVQINRLNNKVIALNIGVGEMISTLQFTSRLGAENRAVAKNEQISNTIEVQVSTLDDIVKTYASSVELIKIDVEGFEWHVIHGGKQVLARDSCNVVIMELNGNGKRFGISDKEIHEKMKEFGYEAYEYFPFERRLVEITLEAKKCEDIIYIKDLENANNRIKNARKFKVFDIEL